MSGALLALLSGIGFGVFQTLNGQVVRQLHDGYLAIYLQMLASAAVLGMIALIAGDLPGMRGWDPEAIAYFGVAGIIHFTFGWYFLSISQKQIGAARTGALLAATPLVGTLLAVPLADQLPGRIALPAIVLMVAGAGWVSSGGEGFGLRGSGWALATAMAWSVSSILVLDGLARLPLIAGGVAVGMIAAVIAHTLMLLATGKRDQLAASWRQAFFLRVSAGVCVALATWGRWAALDKTDVGIVLALNLISAPVVLLLAPLAGRKPEKVDGQLWTGSAVIIVGALILIFAAPG